MTKTIKFFFVLALPLLLLSCKEHTKREYPWGTEKESYIDEDTSTYTLEETGGDSLLTGSAPYHDAAERAERMLKKLQAVKSPDMLLEAMSEYDSYAKETVDDMRLPQEEERLATLRQEVEEAYSEACRNYMLPARGVLQTIQLVRQRLENCDTPAKFNRLMEVRYAYFQNLPQLHRVVAEPNKRRTVHRQAMELQRLFSRKKSEFSK